ncbi:MAG TPA: hypothetical protein VFD82_10480 [Planctomycetota bacterium]|nr:hypothetical protein [Planctomycetota bacterium]
MNGDEILAVVSVAGAFFVFAIMVASMGAAGKRRHELDKLRLDVLKQSLQHPAIDSVTHAELLRVLSRDHEAARRPWTERIGKHTGALRVLWFGLSWALFIVSTGVLIAGELRWLRGVNSGVVLPLAIVGFAMVTMPFAWSEMRARRDAVADRR